MVIVEIRSDRDNKARPYNVRIVKYKQNCFQVVY